MTVSSGFAFVAGYIRGRGRIVLLGNGVVNGSSTEERRLVDIEIYVAKSARLIIVERLYVGSGTNVTVAGTFVLESHVGVSVADLGFERHPNALLNEMLTANWSLPAYDAVDDVVALDSVHPFLRNKLYDLDPEYSDNARDVYVRAGWPVNAEQRPSRYELESSYSLEACAEACEAMSWCNSFDHDDSRLWCALSRLNKGMAGGLSSSTHCTHYERRDSSALRRHSSLPVEIDVEALATITVLPAGLVEMTAEDSDTSKATPLVSIPVQVESDGQVLVASNSILEGGIIARARSNITILDGVTLELSGASGTSFDFDEDALLNSKRSAAMYLSSSAFVRLPRAVESFDRLTITDNSTIRGNHLDLADIKDLRLTNSSKLAVSKNFTVDSEHFTICRDCAVSAAFLRVSVRGNFSLYGSLNSDGLGVTASNVPYDASASTGSGGGHAGVGGSGWNSDGPAGEGGDAGRGCLWWPNTPGGSGASMKNEIQRGGYGGGVVEVNVAGHFSLDGILSANGENGADLEGAGGGAGGSVIVNASKLVGSGFVSANGGSGGYPGGWLVGGGGGGGRVLVVMADVKSSSGFLGTISANAGLQVDAIGAGKLPGVGTVLFYYAKPNLFLLSLDSGISTTTLVRTAGPLNLCKNSVLSTIPVSAIANAASNGFVDAVWLAGGARASVDETLTVRGYDCGLARHRLLWPGWSESCKGDLSGDGTGRLEVDGQLTLPLTSSIHNAHVLFNLSRGRLHGAANLTISAGSSFVLSGTGVLSPSNQLYASWHFSDASSLVQTDQDTAATIKLGYLGFDQSTVEVASNMSLSVGSLISVKSTFKSYFQSENGVLTFELGACIMNDSKITSLDFEVQRAANVTFGSGSLDLGTSTLFRNAGNMRIVETTFQITADSREINTTTASRIVNAENGTFSTLGTLIVIEPRLENYGLLAALESAEISMIGGGSNHASGSMSIEKGSTIFIGEDALDRNRQDAWRTVSDRKFVFAPQARIFGGGRLAVRSRASVQLPSVVGASPEGVMIVVLGGVTEVSPSDSEQKPSSLGNVTIAGDGIFRHGGITGVRLLVEKLDIFDDGTLQVRSGASAIVVSNLNMTGGAMELDLGSNVTAISTTWAGGDVHGPGSITFLKHVKFFGGNYVGVSADDSSSCPRLLNEVRATIAGRADWTNAGNIVISQASELVVGSGSVVNINTSNSGRLARITPGGVLYNFSRTSHSSLSDTWPSPLQLINVTTSQCAEACLEGSGQIEVAKGRNIAGLPIVAMTSLPCRGFDYEYVESRCVLHVRDSKAGKLVANERWHHFRLQPTWASSQIVLEKDTSWVVTKDSSRSPSTENVTIDVFVKTRTSSSVIHVGSEAHLVLRGGGVGNGTFDIGDSSTLEITKPESGVKAGAAIEFSQHISRSTIRGATNAKLVISGGGSHLLPATLQEDRLHISIRDGCIVALPDSANISVASMTILNSSHIDIGSDAILNAISSFVVNTSATVQFGNGKGQIKSRSVMVDTGGVLSSKSILELSGTSKTLLQVDVRAQGRIFASGALNITTRCASALVGGAGVLESSRLFIACDEVTVATKGSVSANGLGAVNSLGTSSSTGMGGGGGGHGGDGGPGASGIAGGLAFGAADAPNLHTGGGSGSPAGAGGGRGGGVVSLIAASGPLSIDGEVSACGAHGVAAVGGGGGAGGSIVLASVNSTWRGSGEVLVEGGDGNRAPRASSAGGGGGGGRIRVVVKDAVLFEGHVSTRGGLGFDEVAGWGWFDGKTSCRLDSCENLTIARDTRYRAAGGTVYIEHGNTASAEERSDRLGSTIFEAASVAGVDASRALWADNDGATPRSGLSASVGFLGVDSLNALVVSGGAMLRLDRGGTFAVDRLLGDAIFPGKLTIMNGTVLESRQEASTTIVSNMTLEISRGSILSSSNTSGLQVGGGGIVELGPGSGCGGSTFSCNLGNLTVERGGVLALLAGSRNDTEMELWERLAPSMRFEYVEVYGRLHTDGAGGRGGNSAAGNASTGSANFGVFASSGGRYGAAGGGGGGHAGAGGDGLGALGGSARNDSTVMWSRALGSGGGGAWEGTGGAGGGRILLRVGRSMYIEGKVSADGEPGTDGGGGGSGGTVSITVDGTCSGTGEISAAGGFGSESYVAIGGAGGGGRVTVQCQLGDASNLRLTAAQGEISAGHNPVEGGRGGAFPGATGKIVDDFDCSFGRAAPGTVVLFHSTQLHLIVGASDDHEATFDNSTYVKSTSVRDLGDATGLIFQSVTVSRPAQVELGMSQALRLQELRSRRDIAAKFKVVENATLEFTQQATIPAGLDLWVGNGMLSGDAFDDGAGSLIVQRDATLTLTVLGKTKASSGLANYTFYGGLHVEGKIQFKSPQFDRVVVLETSSLEIASSGHVHADNQGTGGGVGQRDSASGAESGQSMAWAATLLGGTPRGTGGGHAGRGGGNGQTLPLYDGIEAHSDRNGGYGSAIRPESAGSSGGASDQAPGGAGGGAFRIRVVTGNCLIDGKLSSNGASSSQGGGAGAGGSVWLDVIDGVVSGAGAITSNGGSARGEFGGAGAGGRVAVYARTISISSIEAKPGAQGDTSFLSPAAGTIYINDTSGASLIADGANNSTPSHFATLDAESLAVVEVVVRDGAGLSLSMGEVNASRILDSNGTIAVGRFASLRLANGTLDSNLKLEVYGSLFAPSLNVFGNAVVALLAQSRLFAAAIKIFDGAELRLTATGSANAAGLGRYNLTSLIVSSGGRVSVSSRNESFFFSQDYDYPGHSSYNDIDGSVIISVQRLIIENRGVIDGDGGGYRGGRKHSSSGEGGSAGGTGRGGGGGHGGSGGYSALFSSGGLSRGDATTPIGGGGGGAAGIRGDKGGAGGAGIRLQVSSDALINGVVRSRGLEGSRGAGGGAGGAIWLLVKGRLEGSGNITVDGGSAGILHQDKPQTSIEAGGAGSGGRIAVECSQINAFSGTYSAAGGAQRTPRPDETRTYSVLHSGQPHRSLNLPAGGGNSIDRLREGAMFAAFDAERIAAIHTSGVSRAAPGTVLLSTGTTVLIVSNGDNEVENTTAATITTLIAAENLTRMPVAIALDKIILESDSALSVPKGVALSVGEIAAGNYSGGTIVFEPGASIGAQNRRITIGSNTTTIVRGGANFVDQPAVVVDGAIHFLQSTNTSCQMLSSLDVRGTVGGEIVWLNVSGDVTISGSVSANGLGDWGAAPGIVNLQRWENGNYRQRGGSSHLGGSGAGHGGGGIAGIGALYIEKLADTAKNFVNNSKLNLLDAASAQYLLSNFPSGVPNASLATGQLNDAFDWTVELENRGAAISADDFGVATGRASFVEMKSGGSSLGSFLMNLPSRVFDALGGVASGDAWHPTIAGGGGGAMHAILGHGGRGGGVVRIAAGGVVNITGTVSADGEKGGVGGGGGGAGGSIYFESCYAIAGDGRVTANGGGGGGHDRSAWSVQYGIDSATVGGGGGGGRVSLDAECSAKSWRGLVAAKSGTQNASLDSYLPLVALHLGTVAWVDPLVANATIYTASADGEIAIGDYVDLVSSVKRRAPVQLIVASGRGNGSAYAEDENDAVVRGTWRLRYRSSAWSTRLSTQATAAQVKAALANLDTLDDASIAVTRRLNEKSTAWIWAVTFFDDPLVDSRQLPRTPPLVVVDAVHVYSTAGNATIAVYRAISDTVMGDDYAPASYETRTSVDSILLGVTSLGADYTAEWIRDDKLRVTIKNATGAADKELVKSGMLWFGLNVSLSNGSAIWLPQPNSSVHATWHSR